MTTDNTETQAANSDQISHRADHLLAHQFKPGVSGNPSGRPKRKPITDEIEAVLAETDPRKKQTIARQVAEALIKQAKKGNVKAAALVLDRVEGKVADRIEGEIAGKITVEIVDVDGSGS